MSKFSVDRLQQVTDVFYHASCPDGTASAFICAAAFRHSGLTPKFHSLQYGTEFMSKLEPRIGQLFVDITPPKERWEEWKLVNPIVLDHHETVKNVTEGLDGVYATNEAHSGAQLAYEEVMFPITKDMDLGYIGSVPYKTMEAWKELANRSMIRDTWKKDSLLWNEACSIAMSMLFKGSKGLIAKAQEFGLEAFRHEDLENFYEIGEQVVGNDKRRVETLSGGAEKRLSLASKQYKMSFFNCTEKIVSDTANSLINQGDNISVGYFYLYEDGALRISVSIRTDGTISAKKIAESLGGGGHERAAGFRMNGNCSPNEICDVISGKIMEFYP